MKLGKYLKDKLYFIIIFLLALTLSVLILTAFKVPLPLIITEAFILVTSFAVVLLIDFFRKRQFYNDLVSISQALDEKYFSLETLKRPDFLEGQLLFDVVGDMEHSMSENVKKHRLGMESFKEYVEMWIHEIKLPIASLTLMFHNHTENVSDDMASRMNTQLRRINNYIEQILYYVRSENAEKDYIITDVRLSKIIGAVALKNKDDLLENNITFNVENADMIVLTDSKWMEFMLNQIVSNSIKYQDKSKSEACIRIKATENKKCVVLEIEDNGIGIAESDLPRVFDKSFTGENGREYSKATGMGLYIVKKLCDKMGHRISIQSQKGEYTRVTITFFKNDFYKELL